MSNLFSRGESWELPARGIRPLFALAINANIKVLLDFFQKIAGVQGTASLVALRRGRNPFSVGRIFEK